MPCLSTTTAQMPVPHTWHLVTGKRCRSGAQCWVQSGFRYLERILDPSPRVLPDEGLARYLQLMRTPPQVPGWQVLAVTHVDEAPIGSVQTWSTF